MSSPAAERLYVCGAIAKGWVVGAKLPVSGLFVRTGEGQWEHRGFNHPYLAALDVQPGDPATLFLAAGNGAIRAARGGREWRILTGHEVTELRDIAADPNAPGTLYIAHTLGISVTRDGGATWNDAGYPGPRRYTESVRVDRTRAGRLVAGGERGLFHSTDGGRNWALAGAAGFQVMHLEQSPHDAALWLAVTQQGGIFRSLDGGRSFETLGELGRDRNLYDVAFDPATPGRIAVAGWGPGVAVSEDGGKTWQLRNAGLPRPDVWSVTFDPQRPGRLWASVHEEALFVSDDAGKNWRSDGLEGGVVFRMKWVAEAGQ
jgi:photosystem II stability/assembly factor-like uncharacterized protein